MKADEPDALTDLLDADC